MGNSVDVESVTQNFMGQTDDPKNTTSDYMTQEKLYSLKKRLIPDQLRLLTKLLQIQAAQKTVCSEVWFKYYIDSLNNTDRDKIDIDRSNNSFKCGYSKIIKSNRPVFSGRMQVKLTADVIDYGIPLLLSKDSIKMTNAMIDFKNDEIIMFRRTIDIIHTDSGHYDILLNNFIKKDEFIDQQISYFCSYLKNRSLEQKKKIAVDFHQQFVHPSGDKLIGLLKQGDVNDEGLKNIKDINFECDICMRYRKAKRKPIVAFPLPAKSFNETIAMDLKHWSDSPKIWFLHIIDHFTQYNVLCVVRS